MVKYFEAEILLIISSVVVSFEWSKMAISTLLISLVIANPKSNIWAMGIPKRMNNDRLSLKIW